MSISITRKLGLLLVKHPSFRHVLKPVAPFIIKSLTKDYQRITTGPVKKQEQ